MVKFYNTKVYLWAEIGEFIGTKLVKHTCPACGFKNPWFGGVSVITLKDGDRTCCDKCGIEHHLSEKGLTLDKKEIIEALVAPSGYEIFD